MQAACRDRTRCELKMQQNHLRGSGAVPAGRTSEGARGQTNGDRSKRCEKLVVIASKMDVFFVYQPFVFFWGHTR